MPVPPVSTSLPRPPTERVVAAPAAERVVQRVAGQQIEPAPPVTFSMPAIGLKPDAVPARQVHRDGRGRARHSSACRRQPAGRPLTLSTSATVPPSKSVSDRAVEDDVEGLRWRRRADDGSSGVAASCVRRHGVRAIADGVGMNRCRRRHLITSFAGAADDGVVAGIAGKHRASPLTPSPPFECASFSTERRQDVIDAATTQDDVLSFRAGERLLRSVGRQ